jgi:hypothetical protein
MIGDFDGSANPLWSLYGKEAKSHDQSRIQTLKDDMDGVLIFVCFYFVPRSTSLITLMRCVVGRFIFCCTYRIHSRWQTEFEAKPSRSDGVLPSTECRHSLPDLKADLICSPTGLHPFHSACPFPYFQPIGI